MEAQQTQTVMTLYSETLSAVILITDDQLGFYSGLQQFKFSLSSLTIKLVGRKA